MVKNEIEGEIENQTDLKNALDGKPNIGDHLSLTGQNGIMFNGNTKIYETVDGELSISVSNTIFRGTVEASNLSGTNTGDQDLSGKVDKVSGKGLSTNDYTENEKQKLAGIEAGAQVNVPTDWDGGTGYMPILNKPNTFPPSSHNHTHNDMTGLNDGDYQHLTVDEKTKLSSAVTSSTITSIITLTQTAYDALPIKDPAVMYVITGV